ncbi:unnamed protein product [Protopolystoma xenopodis]|uniref:Uncharacterized protein n=1 Tax=Protopolystoma xenopodis TaxID=117903 RepID=A0A448XQ58_9PLAT|nr:unnamed protein product [Protopolystoma xenopodis]
MPHVVMPIITNVQDYQNDPEASLGAAIPTGKALSESRLCDSPLGHSSSNSSTLSAGGQNRYCCTSTPLDSLSYTGSGSAGSADTVATVTAAYTLSPQPPTSLPLVEAGMSVVLATGGANETNSPDAGTPPGQTTSDIEPEKAVPESCDRLQQTVTVFRGRSSSPSKRFSARCLDGEGNLPRPTVSSLTDSNSFHPF